MTQAVATPSIAHSLRAILNAFAPRKEQRAPADLPPFSPCQRLALRELAERGETMLVRCAMDDDRALVHEAEQLVIEPLRTIYRASSGKRNALDERRINNALLELDCAIGSLAENLIDRGEAEDKFDEGLSCLRAAADGRKIHLDPSL